jgi:GH24 family phage-related lysozyme (muramidase)
MIYPLKYIEAFNLIKTLEGKASDCKGGYVCTQIGNTDYGTYYDHYGHLTAGVGHLLTPAELSAYNTDPIAKHYWDNLTEHEALDIYKGDFTHHVHRAIYYTPELDSLPLDVATQIIAATYRGSWGYSVKARELFNSGQYKEAASEFLNSNEYVNGTSGIKKRMEAVADAIESMATEQVEVVVIDKPVTNNDQIPIVLGWIIPLVILLIWLKLKQKVILWQINRSLKILAISILVSSKTKMYGELVMSILAFWKTKPNNQ